MDKLYQLNIQIEYYTFLIITSFCTSIASKPQMSVQNTAFIEKLHPYRSVKAITQKSFYI